MKIWVVVPFFADEPDIDELAAFSTVEQAEAHMASLKQKAPGEHVELVPCDVTLP